MDTRYPHERKNILNICETEKLGESWEVGSFGKGLHCRHALTQRLGDKEIADGGVGTD